MTSAASLDTRTRILDTALELFSEHGFDGTTLQQIADRLGFTKAALYYHFRSKDALLQATVTPAQRRRFMEDYLDHLLCHRRLIAYMVSDLAIVAHPLIAIGSADRRARMQSMLAGDGLDFHDQVCVTMAFRGIGGVIAQYPDADTAELREALLDAARALLRPARRRPPQRTAPRRQARRPHPVGGS
jgi:AcrR family transcriptional regulator